MLLDIKKMHEHFKITSEKIPEFTREEKKFRIAAMQEELNEYEFSNRKEDELDALVDLVVFALGTAERQGMLDVFREAYSRVMAANMTKELGPNDKRGSFELDLVKPEDWVAPDLRDLIKGEK